MVLDGARPSGVRQETAAVSWVGSSRAKYDALRSRKTEIDFRGARNSSLGRGEPLHLLRAADAAERLVELDPHAVRGPVADVRDYEEEEAPDRRRRRGSPRRRSARPACVRVYHGLDFPALRCHDGRE